MDKRRLVVFGICLALCLAAGGTAMATTIQQGGVHYPPGHYLEGEEIQTGFDIFGGNWAAQTFVGWQLSNSLAHQGFPPYHGDEESYFEDIATTFGISVAEAESLVTSMPEWIFNRTWGVYRWNDAFMRPEDGDGDGCIDFHPYSPTHGPGDSVFAPGFRGSGAACAMHVRNFPGLLVFPHGLGYGTMNITWVSVPLDATRDHPYGTWYDGDGNEIGWDWGPLTWGMDDCWAVVRNVCWCGDVLVWEYHSPTVPAGLGD
jgi:hypothetical protein